MKTVKGLHEKMYTFDNANISFHKAAENKRFHEEAVSYTHLGTALYPYSRVWASGLLTDLRKPITA